MYRQKLKILGCGQVIREALPLVATRFPDLHYEIYCRQPPNSQNSVSIFRSHLEFESRPGDISIIACSTDETEYCEKWVQGEDSPLLKLTRN